MNSELYKKNVDINKILEKSIALNDKDIEYFKSLADAIFERQNDFFNNIQKNTIELMSGEEKYNSVFTFLSTDQNYSKDVFSPILEEDEDDNDIVFIDCPYDEIKNYETVLSDKKIKLEKTDVFIKKERILSTLFRMYNINLPYIYSPYSRRAFKVSEYDEKSNSYKPVDFKREKIDINIDSIVYGKLLWNICITKSQKLRPDSVVVNDKQFWRYSCTQNSFVIPVFKENDDYTLPEYYKNTEEKYVDILNENDDWDSIFDKVEIVENLNIRDNQFENISSETKIAPKRILTQADIWLAVDKYYLIPEEFKGTSYNTNNNSIKDYSRDDRYSYSDLSNIARKNNNICYLKFSDSGKDNFFIDRVNCFIAFMRYNYPNFYWVGIRE